MANYDEQLGLNENETTIKDEGLDVVERVVALDPDSQYQNLPIASTIAPGIAQFDKEFFAVDGDGNVSLVKDLAEAADNARESAEAAAESARQSEASAEESAQHAADSLTYANQSKGYRDESQGYSEQSSGYAEQSKGYSENSAESARQSGVSADQSTASATEAKNAQTLAEQAQQAAETARDGAQTYEQNAQDFANDAKTQAEAAAQSATASANSASQSLQYKNEAQGFADEAEGYMEQAKEYAKKEYKVYNSFDDLPIPGDSAFIYLVSTGTGTSNDTYSEYLWISEDNKYEYIGSVNDIDLSNYAQINGTYPNMMVGNATNAGNAASADSADKVANSLTINIDGESITFDGSAARTVDINTTSSTDPEAVHFTEQALTSEQQTQARENIGAAGTSGNYPNMTVGNATHADSADSAAKATQDGNGDNIAATYAKQSGSYPNMTAGEAKGLSKVGSVYADSASRVGWHKFAEVPLSALTAVSGASSYSAIVLVNGLNPYQGGEAANSGIVEVDIRVDGSQFTSSTPPQIKLLSGNVDIQKLCFKRTDTEVGLYINTSSIYVRYSFTVLDERYYLGRSVDAMEFADEYYGAAAPEGAVYATNVNQAAYAQEAAMLDEAYKAGNNSSTSQNGYVKLIDFTAGNNWAEKTLRLEFGDDNASNVPQNPCGMEIRVQWNSSDGVSPRAVLLYGDKQIADKLYVSYNPSFTEGEENTVSVYYKVSGGYDMVAYKPLYMTPRQGTDVTGVNFYQPTQSDLIAELPSGNTNTAITALENFRDLRYAKYDANGNDISDTYATKSDLNAGLQRLYPVGSIYFSAVGTNPSELFGFGTWQAWGAGRVPVGVDASQTEFNAVEKTGGEKAHALTINEMPSHTHEISYRPIGDPSDDPFALFKSEGGITGTYNSPGTELSQDALEAKAAGGGQAHNNLQPYITCYMWKRTA